MKYYKDSENQVYAYNDGYEEIKDGLTAITEAEAMAIANPPPTRDQVIEEEFSNLNLKYKNDVNTLTGSYAIAALADGPNQNTKQTAIYQQYQSLKAQYISDLAALKIKYGV